MVWQEALSETSKEALIAKIQRSMKVQAALGAVAAESSELVVDSGLKAERKTSKVGLQHAKRARPPAPLCRVPWWGTPARSADSIACESVPVQ